MVSSNLFFTRPPPENQLLCHAIGSRIDATPQQSPFLAVYSRVIHRLKACLRFNCSVRLGQILDPGFHSGIFNQIAHTFDEVGEEESSKLSLRTVVFGLSA
jgi:hypothetical protein